MQRFCWFPLLKSPFYMNWLRWYNNIRKEEEKDWKIKMKMKQIYRKNSHSTCYRVAISLFRRLTATNPFGKPNIWVAKPNTVNPTISRTLGSCQRDPANVEGFGSMSSRFMIRFRKSNRLSFPQSLFPSKRIVKNTAEMPANTSIVGSIFRRKYDFT